MKVIQEQISPDGIYSADTGITVDEWFQMLNDGTIKQRQKEILLCFYREPGHKGICNVLAKKYGGNDKHFSNPIWRIGKSVQKRLARFEVLGVENDGSSSNDNVYWVVPMTGKRDKQGFCWMIKPELCEAIEQYLYHDLIEIYKKRRKTIDLIEDDELYKWEIVNKCSNKPIVEMVKTIVNHPKNNLIDWRQKDYFRKMAEQDQQSLEEIMNILFDDTIDIHERITYFLSHSGDSRSLSVFLGCQNPDKYLFYKDSYYGALTDYLGLKKVSTVSEKYIHYTEIMKPLVALVSKDDELHQLLNKNIGDLRSSDLLIAQDIVYTLFERHIIKPITMNDIFDWIPFYTELAVKLLEYKESPDELASLIYEHFDRETEIRFLHDGDGSDFKEIDPFTVYSIFNRNTKNRKDLVMKIKSVFGVDADVPSSFEGIPTHHSMNASFYCFTEDRSPDGKDLERLWSLYELALEDNAEMEEVFNKVLKQLSIAIPKMTIGLYYINPYKYLPLDGNNRRYLEEYGVSTKNHSKMQYANYMTLLQQVTGKMENHDIVEQTYPEFTANAYGGNGGSDDGTDSEYYQELVELLRFKKNIIIEGAPGVGKTYELPRIISRLCYPEWSNAPDSVLKEKFKALKENHQVAFVTFHQSMDYEEFVEGIRPETTEDGNVAYKIEDGIFKRICERARKPIVEDNNLNISEDATIWKVSLAGTRDNEVRSECMANNHIRIGWDHWGEDLSQVQEARYEGKIILDAFYNRMKIGDIVFSCYSSRTIDAIGVVTGDAEWHDEFDGYKRVRNVEWLVKGINEDIYDLNDQTSMTLGTVYRLNNINLDQVFSILNKYGVNQPTEAKKNDRPYVLVIDEINRGNVSKIFGELITLIEPDKRLGRESETEVILPYSKKVFSIPDNLYIIGTMNTADRSLDTLDYAMRRRFAFVKYKPIALNIDSFNIELFTMVSKLFISNFEEYNEDDTVALIPSECLADDIQPENVWIGHSYFIMNDENGVDRTGLRIQYEIIPILEEYIKDGVFKDPSRVYEVIGELKHYTDD